MVSAKLFVPSGGFDQLNAGEIFSPTQLALPAVLLENFLGINVPSLKAGDEMTNGSAASTARLKQFRTKTNPKKP